MNFIKKIRYWKKYNLFFGLMFLFALVISLWNFVQKSIHNSYAIEDLKVHIAFVASFGFTWAFVNIVDYLVVGLSNISGRSD